MNELLFKRAKVRIFCHISNTCPRISPIFCYYQATDAICSYQDDSKKTVIIKLVDAKYLLLSVVVS